MIYAPVNSSCAQPHPPGLLRNICPPFQFRRLGICKVCAARGPGICQPRGYSRAFDTRAVSYQNITTQVYRGSYWKKSRLAHLSRTGGCKGMFSILCMHFLHCLSSQNYIGKLGSYRHESTLFG